MRNEKRNKFAPKIDAELDLHGMSEAAAIISVTTFLQRAEDSGYQKVRIITGKGRGILQNSVRQWLRDERRFFETAKINEGGAGALVVTL